MKFTGGKDTDRYLLERLDDRELFSIMQTNKEYLKLGQDFFEKRMKKKYPILAARKPKDVTWFKYYIDNVFYISKLKEVYDLDYYNLPSFYPKTIYHRLYYATSTQTLREYKISFLIENREYEEAIKFIKGLNFNHLPLEHYIRFISLQALRTGNLDLFEKLTKERQIRKPYDDLHFVDAATKSGNKEILDYILDNIDIEETEDIFRAGIDAAVQSGNVEMLTYFKKRYPREKIDWYVTSNALRGENLELFKEYLKKDFSMNRKGFLQFMLDSKIIDIIKEGKLDFLKYAIEMYKGKGGNMKNLAKNIELHFKNSFQGILDRDIKKYLEKVMPGIYILLH